MSNIKAGTRQLVVSSEDFPGGKFRFDVAEPPTTKLNTIVREALGGPTGIVGYVESHEAAYIEATVNMRDTVDLNLILAARDCTVTLAHANGHVEQLTGAWVANSPERSAAGTATIRWESGTPGQVLGVQR